MFFFKFNLHIKKIYYYVLLFFLLLILTMYIQRYLFSPYDINIKISKFSDYIYYFLFLLKINLFTVVTINILNFK